MKSVHTRKLVAAALFAALIYVATAFFTVPLPTGYANLGDCFCILAGVLLGPVFGPLAAAVGSAIADLLLGYTVYAPATFLIKGGMALIAWLVYTRLRAPLPLRLPLGCLCAECVVVGGYFVYEWLLYGPAAVATLLGNSIQGLIGGFAAAVILLVLEKHPALTRWLQ